MENLGGFVFSQLVLIRGMAPKAQEVIGLFLEQVRERGMPNISISSGHLTVVNESRAYYFVERDLGRDAKATIAVRIAPAEEDLYIEWRHYVLPSRELNWGCLILGLIFVLPVLGVPVVFDESPILGLAMLMMYIFWIASTWKTANRNRADTLDGSQIQDSSALQQSVRACLEESIALAGIPKDLVQEVSGA